MDKAVWFASGCWMLSPYWFTNRTPTLISFYFTGSYCSIRNCHASSLWLWHQSDTTDWWMQTDTSGCMYLCSRMTVGRKALGYSVVTYESVYQLCIELKMTWQGTFSFQYHEVLFYNKVKVYISLTINAVQRPYGCIPVFYIYVYITV